MTQHLQGQEQEYTHSVIGAYIGPKRSGKSLSITAVVVGKLCAGEKVWSEMKIHTGEAILSHHTFPNGSRSEYRETLPLELDKFYSLDESIQDGTVVLDEISYYASAISHMSNKNKLLNTCMRQAGHRNLNLLYSARSFQQVDTYLRAETDFVCECSDDHFTAWGVENHVPGGRAIFQRYFDVSGAITGHQVDFFSPKKVPYLEQTLHGSRFLDCYDTKQLISIEEANTPIKMDMRARIISNKEDDSVILERVAIACGELALLSNDLIPALELWEGLHSKGINLAPNVLGRYLPKGIRKKQTRNDGVMYDLSAL